MKESDAQYEQVKRLEELENANQRLSEQVKRLLKTEHELYQTQEQLDTQIRLYRQLHEFGNKFNATFDLAEVLHIATEFVLYKLNFERCLVLLRSEEAKDFCVQALDGYYDEDARQSVAEMSLSVEEPALLPLYSDLGQVMRIAGCDQEHLLALGRAFGMAEYVIFPLVGESQNPIGLLVAGNTADNLPYHTRVQPDSEFVVGLANLASMATTTINNVSFYQALRESEERYRTLFDGVPVGLYRTTPAGQFMDANLAMVQMLGYPSREDLVAMNTASLYVDPEERVRWKALMEREGVVRDFEIRNRRYDGTVIWVNNTARAVKDEQGQVLYYEGSLEDITERKQAEAELRRYREHLEELVEERTAELRESEERYRTLFDGVPVGLYRTTPAGQVLDANLAAVQMLGYPSRNDLLAASTASLFTDPMEAARARVLLDKGEIVRDFEMRLNRYDGTVIWVNYAARAVRDKRGQVLHYEGSMEDITERKKLEEEIHRQKDYFEALFVNSPVAALTADLDGSVVSWNPMAEKLFGYTQEEAIGRNVDDLVANDPRVREEALRYTSQILTKGRIQATTKRTRKDGSLIDVEVRALPVIVAGELVGYVAIYHDIGELQRARREAEQASQAKSAFLATMSHEIRTPMNAVIGMTSLLLDTDLTLEQRGFTETIRTSGDTLLTIINDILDFSKIEAGKLELENQPFDLRECVEGALDLLATRAAEKGLDLAYFIETGAPAAIFGDVTRLSQILVNLLSNAVKFTEEGEVVISVTSRPPEDGRHELLFAVRDTGVGIPPDRMDRLFQSFSQVDASTTRRYGGTGLGLAISKRLSEMMGGTMWAESDGVPGKGSTFHFTIQTKAAPSPPRAYLQAAQPDLSGKRVLIVDDNATNRQILTLQTRAWGMLPRDTGSPIEALDWIHRGDPFDVAVLDMQMPEMDGLMLAAEIRRERDAQALPLIMLTSGQREADTEGIELAAFLTKPIKASQLYNVLVGLFAEGVRPIERRDVAAKAQFDAGMGQRLPLRILLAEDNVINQQVALSFLERLGYRADVAANGLEVLRSLWRQPYDVVLMDVHMPEMDGLEATRRIRQELAVEAQPRIIAMTADAMKEDREACLSAGMEDYISKPVQVGELVAALSKCQPRLAMEAQKRSEVVETPATAGSPEVLDPGALKLLRATLGKQADRMLPGLIERFYQDVDRLLGEARQALEQGETTDLRRAGHSLKSTSATFGAMMLSGVARELEYLARDGVLEGAAGLIARAKAEFARAKAALEAMREEL